jgi:hypothetical protein
MPRKLLALAIVLVSFGPRPGQTQVPAPLLWCAPSRAFYPTVQTCAAPWQSVSRPPGLSGGQPAQAITSGADTHCESISDKRRRDACFAQAGIPVVNCASPQDAADAAFCRESTAKKANRVAQPKPAVSAPAPSAQSATTSTVEVAPAAPATLPSTVPAAAEPPADRLQAVAGQPLCIDQDSLATLILSGLMASNGIISSRDVTSDGCQFIPAGAQVDVLERYASGSDVMRVVKVRVTSLKLHGPTIGYTVEIGK